MSSNNASEKKVLLKLRDVRRSKGLSLNALAKKAGIDYQRVGRAERGETQMTIDMLDKIAKVLQVPLAQLLTDEEVNINVIQNSMKQKVENNSTIYLIPSIYNHFEELCNRHNLHVDNRVKVHLATVMFKAIQDIRAIEKDDEHVLKALFQVFDAVLERLVLN